LANRYEWMSVNHFPYLPIVTNLENNPRIIGPLLSFPANPFGSFCAKRLTDRQTNNDKNLTSFVEVMNQKLGTQCDFTKLKDTAKDFLNGQFQNFKQFCAKICAILKRHIEIRFKYSKFWTENYAWKKLKYGCKAKQHAHHKGKSRYTLFTHTKSKEAKSIYVNLLLVPFQTATDM